MPAQQKWNPNSPVRRACKESLRAFLSECQISDDQSGQVVPLRPTPSQLPVLNRLAASRCGAAGQWLIINKPRQAQTSTLCLGWILREIMLSPGSNGLVIADKNERNDELWTRLRHMYDHLPSSLSIPTRSDSAKTIQFCGPTGKPSGRIKSITASGKDPGLGLSIDRLLCSEFGFWKDETVLEKLIPALAKRPHARIVIESTPGAHGGQYHRMWMDALSKGRDAMFTPIFLRWYDYPVPVRGRGHSEVEFVPDQSELAYLNTHPHCSYTHLAFRRWMLEGAFRGSVAAFEHAYPSDPYSGWDAGNNQSLVGSIDILKEAHLRALPDPNFNLPNTMGWKPRNLGHKYMVVADPTGYGQVGDEAAFTVFDLNEREEVSAWSARLDPIGFAAMLAKHGAYWNNALVVVESNKDAAVTALINNGYRNVYYSGKGNPGYFRTAGNKESSLAQFEGYLRSGQIKLNSKAGIGQLMAYDGSDRRSQGSSAGSRSHFDRAICYFIAADVMRENNVPLLPDYEAEARLRQQAASPLHIPTLTVAQFERLHSTVVKRKGL
jgi:hypothetical protein